MVPVRKKSGDIRICIDFRNLNKACQKDNFPLPPMEQILQAVAGSELMSFLDGFSRYNQVMVHPGDQLKTTFRTKWGTYAYRKMPFGLINASATFQRAMDIAFKGLVNKSVVIYFDDITVYSKKRSDHLKDFKQIFQRCLRCLEKTEAEKVLQELHDGPTGRYYVGDAIAHKILHAGYYLPTLFKDSHSYVKKCQICQTTAGRQKKPSMPLQPINIEQPFSQWGLDIIDQFIITRFGLPTALMFDNASYFSGNAMIEFALKRGLKLKYSANYYPQGNGLAESTNKNLIRIIKRTVDQNQKNWHKTLVKALWADRITKKASIGTSPFNLVYGKEVVLPTHLIIPSLSLVQYIDEVSTSSLQLRQMEIIKLEEKREQTKKTHARHQALIKSSFNSSIMTRKNFQMGDLVLKWDKAHEEKGKHTKFQKMWLGPFQIVQVIGPSTFVL
eukprot:PITA_24466